MKLQSKTKIHSSLIKACVALIFATSLSANCQYQMFNITSAKGTRIINFVNQLSKDCQFSVLVTDKYAKRVLESRLSQTYIKNLTLNEVFKTILSNNNLFYSFHDNTLKISYLHTKTFNIDYILSQRKGTGSTDITIGSTSTGDSSGLMSGSSGSSSSGTSTQSSDSNGQASSGMKIESTDEVEFWNKLDKQLQQVVNRPEDSYVAQEPIINRNAGLITVTATKRQLDRLSTYLERLQKKVGLQVLINVQLLSVTMNKSETTGIDWSQLYALENGTAKFDYLSSASTGSTTSTTSTTGTTGTGLNGLVTINVGGSLNQVIKFLKTQGNVHSISNPKVLTLNNQPALITSGTQYFYTLTQSQNSNSSGGTTTATNQVIQSVFAGVLLDITPEISDTNMITLKINPSLSATVQSMADSTSATRTSPPDLQRRQLSSVVTVKNGSRIILGGLINTVTTVNDNKVPLLGDIPGLSYLFSHKAHSKEVQELVIIIQPHIIHNGKSQLSLSDLGYENINNSLMNKKNVDSNTTKKADTASNGK